MDLPSYVCVKGVDIAIACWNTRGFLTSVPYLKQLLQNNDIIAISEHWLHANRLQDLNGISNEFNCISRASKHSGAEVYGIRRGQGGVALFWRKSLAGASPMSDITHDHICGLRIQLKTGQVINIFSIYLPTQGSCDNFDITMDELVSIINSKEDHAFNIVAGDFNGDVGYLGGHRSNRKPTNISIKVNNFFREFNLFPANLDESAVGPITTFKGGMGDSTIDYLAIPEGLRNYLKECQVFEGDICNTSDHYAVRADLNLQCLPKLCTILQAKGRVKWAKPNVIVRYQGLVSEELCDITANFDVNNPSPETVDALVDDLVNCLVKGQMHHRDDLGSK